MTHADDVVTHADNVVTFSKTYYFIGATPLHNTCLMSLLLVFFFLSSDTIWHYSMNRSNILKPPDMTSRTNHGSEDHPQQLRASYVPLFFFFIIISNLYTVRIIFKAIRLEICRSGPISFKASTWKVRNFTNRATRIKISACKPCLTHFQASVAITSASGCQPHNHNWSHSFRVFLIHSERNQNDEQPHIEELHKTCLIERGDFCLYATGFIPSLGERSCMKTPEETSRIIVSATAMPDVHTHKKH